MFVVSIGGRGRFVRKKRRKKQASKRKKLNDWSKWYELRIKCFNQLSKKINCNGIPLKQQLLCFNISIVSRKNCCFAFVKCSIIGLGQKENITPLSRSALTVIFTAVHNTKNKIKWITGVYERERERGWVLKLIYEVKCFKS